MEPDEIDPFIESKCVLEIKELGKYAVGETFYSEKVYIGECDLEWMIAFSPFIEDRIEDSMVVVAIELKSDPETVCKFGQYDFHVYGTVATSNNEILEEHSFSKYERKCFIINHCRRSNLIDALSEMGTLLLTFILKISDEGEQSPM